MTKSKTHKIIASALLITITLTAFWLQNQAHLRPLTLPLHTQLDASIKETALTFAAARAVNAVVSLVQESSFGFSLGINVSIAAGQILDPLNDLIERFSQLTLACLIALSMQKVLLDLGIVLATAIAIPISALTGLLALWWVGKLKDRFRNLCQRFSLISLFLLLGLPISILATELCDRLLLSTQINAANGRINQISQELAEESEQATPLPQNEGRNQTSLLDRIKRSSEQTQAQLEQSTKVLALLDQIKSLDTDTLIEDIILLCGLYLLRALLLPIMMLWLTYRLGIYMLSLFNPEQWQIRQPETRCLTEEVMSVNK